MDTEFDLPDTNPPSRLPGGKRKRSILHDDTASMDRKRRQIEQEGHRQLAKVNAREHPDDQSQEALEGDLQNTIRQHPYFDTQLYDGAPPLNTEARRKFDNERREQEMEKQLRLGNMPQYSSTPKPKGP